MTSAPGAVLAEREIRLGEVLGAAGTVPALLDAGDRWWAPWGDRAPADS